MPSVEGVSSVHDRIVIGLFIVTPLIAIPCSIKHLLMLYGLFRRLPAISKNVYRPSNQLTFHIMCWTLYLATSLAYAAHSLILWIDASSLASPHTEFIQHLLIALNLASILLLPLAMLLVTIDRLISLGAPKYFPVINGDTEKWIVRCSAIFLFVLFTLVIMHGSTVGEGVQRPCYLVGCLKSDFQLMTVIILYKVACGLLNILLSLLFACLLFAHNRRSRINQVDDHRNHTAMLVVVCELLVNILPSSAYFFIRGESAPLILGVVLFDALMTTLAYSLGFRRLKRSVEGRFPMGGGSRQRRRQSHVGIESSSRDGVGASSSGQEAQSADEQQRRKNSLPWEAWQ